MGSGQMTLF